jgi:hypothetical protein
MNAFLLPICLLISVACFSQKLKVDEVDKFTKQKRLETEEVKMNNKTFEGFYLYLRAVDTITYITISGYGQGADVIGQDDQALFLLDDNSTVTVLSTGIQDYTIGQYSKSYHHQYRINVDDIQTLADHSIKSVRKYGAGGYVDMDVPEKKQESFKKTAALFLSKLKE